MISGLANRAPYRWTRFEASHIFLLGAENLWTEMCYARWIMKMDNMVGVSRINSCRNGFLLEADIYQVFDQHSVSVNQDESGGSTYS
ncbi:hypothetical protein BGX38DRAFT_1194785 [Terfezia claveryi]|nr:hypothetical protein BGX38DRAFT_1194785 [Terfezia claveryi]